MVLLIGCLAAVIAFSLVAFVAIKLVLIPEMEKSGHFDIIAAAKQKEQEEISMKKNAEVLEGAVKKDVNF